MSRVKCIKVRGGKGFIDMVCVANIGYIKDWELWVWQRFSHCAKLCHLAYPQNLQHDTWQNGP